MQEEYLQMSNWGIAFNSIKLIFKNPKLLVPYIVPYIFFLIAGILSNIGKNSIKVENGDIGLGIICLSLAATFLCIGFWKLLTSTLVVIRGTSKLLRGNNFVIKVEKEWTKDRIWGYAWLCTILSVIYLIFLIISGIIISFTLKNLVLAIISIIVLTIIGVYYSLHVILSNQIYALSNNIGGLDAIMESFEFTKKHKLGGDIIITGFSLMILLLIPSIILYYIPIFGQIILSVINAIASLVTLTHIYLKAIYMPKNQE